MKIFNRINDFMLDYFKCGFAYKVVGSLRYGTNISLWVQNVKDPEGTVACKL